MSFNSAKQSSEPAIELQPVGVLDVIQILPQQKELRLLVWPNQVINHLVYSEVLVAFIRKGWIHLNWHLGVSEFFSCLFFEYGLEFVLL